MNTVNTVNTVTSTPVCPRCTLSRGRPHISRDSPSVWSCDTQKVVFLKIYIFMLPTFWGHKNLSCGTFIFHLAVGSMFKPCNLSVDFGKVLQCWKQENVGFRNLLVCHTTRSQTSFFKTLTSFTHVCGLLSCVKHKIYNVKSLIKLISPELTKILEEHKEFQEQVSW